MTVFVEVITRGSDHKLSIKHDQTYGRSDYQIELCFFSWVLSDDSAVISSLELSASLRCAEVSCLFFTLFHVPWRSWLGLGTLAIAEIVFRR